MTPTEISYLTFGIVLLLALIFDFGLFSKKNSHVTMKSAFYQSVFWVVISIAFCVFLFFEDGSKVATKFLTAYLMEKSLSIDNIFVFILIFASFKVADSDTARALLIGILLAIVFRIIFIAIGIGLIERFHWILYIFGIFLVYTGYKLFFKKDEEEFNPGESKLYRLLRKYFRLTTVEPKGKYMITRNGKVYFTTLSVVVFMLAAIDIVFALDSIPTVVSIVRERADVPFSPDDVLVIYSSNIFAILGLRALFFLLKGAVNKFDFLQQGIAVVLIFIGIKMLIEFFDIHISIYISLAVIVICLTASILYSVHHNRKIPEQTTDV
ncbi:MAG: TerC/Alx family metal homeostasis membrane protein [Chitinophagaceae bacterium]|nr:TerC/Alx family metal homeostasis membrane protein [Chitinophagaceae bacterium]